MFLKAADFQNLKTVSEPQWNNILVTDVDILVGFKEICDPNQDAEIIYHRAPVK
jgi:hypothetical protein